LENVSVMLCRARILSQVLILTAAFATCASAQSRWGGMSLGSGAATGINNDGAIVGSFYFEGGTHGFVWTRAEGMTELGFATPNGINNSGHVVGSRHFGFDGPLHAFLWTALDGMMDLGTPPGSTQSIAYGINDADWVVGRGYRQPTEFVCCDRAFLWTPAEGMMDLGTLGGGTATAFAINNAGQVVGESTGATFVSTHAFLWTPTEGMIDLGTLGGTTSTAFGINNAGQVVGVSTTSSGAKHAFLWTEASGMIDLGTNVRGDSSAAAISDSGLIVGSRQDPFSSAAVLWTPSGSAIDVGTGYSRAVGINARGEIVGFSGGARLWYPREDAAFDFPNWGTWILTAEGWTSVHGLNAIAMVTADLDGNGIDDLVMNFGPDAGLWAWMNHDTWLFLHGLSPSGMIAGQLDEIAGDEIIATFPGWGMWRWSAGVWEQWHTLDGIPLAIGELDDLGPLGNDVLADFPGYGIYLFHGGAVPWRYINLLHTLSPRTTVLADLDGDGTSELVASFPGYGVWVYRNNANGEKWTQLHGRDAVHLAAGEIDQTPGVDLVIDFGPTAGIWTLRNNTTWSQLHTLSAETVTLIDRDQSGIDDVIVDFGAPYGVWEYANDSTWSLLHPVSPGRIVAGRFH